MQAMIRELKAYIRMREGEVEARQDCLFTQSNGLWGALQGRTAKNKIAAAKKVLVQLKLNTDSIHKAAKLNLQDVDMLSEGRLGTIMDKYSDWDHFPLNVIIAREEAAQNEFYLHIGMKH